MVQLTEVEDEAFNTSQPGPEKDDEDDWDTDTGMSDACIRTEL